MTSAIEIEGAKKLARTFDRLAAVIDKEESEDVMFDAAVLVSDEARRRAPVGPTGNLKKSIKAKRFSRNDPGVPAAFAAVDRVVAPHAHLVEFGTVNMGPRPFFRSAIEAVRSSVERLIANRMWDIIQRVR